jgi:lipoprotein-anchoring transpeptidase ErfK/SrfK
MAMSAGDMARLNTGRDRGQRSGLIGESWRQSLTIGGVAFRRQFGRVAAAAAALPFPPAFAQLVDKYAEQLTNGEFNWYPDRSTSGPIIAIVSLPDQRVYVYRNGVRIAASSCSTGKLGHRTPTGVFKILQKDKNHHSSTYNNAPMPT